MTMTFFVFFYTSLVIKQILVAHLLHYVKLCFLEIISLQELR